MLNDLSRTVSCMSVPVKNRWCMCCIFVLLTVLVDSFYHIQSTFIFVMGLICTSRINFVSAPMILYDENYMSARSTTTSKTQVLNQTCGPCT